MQRLAGGQKWPGRQQLSGAAASAGWPARQNYLLSSSPPVAGLAAPALGARELSHRAPSSPLRRRRRPPPQSSAVAGAAR
eukprot:13016052-Alexandrium_andersonii.AAC.1